MRAVFLCLFSISERISSISNSSILENVKCAKAKEEEETKLSDLYLTSVHALLTEVNKSADGEEMDKDE